MNLLTKGIYTLIIAFILGVLACPALIPFLHRLKFGQTVRDDSPPDTFAENRYADHGRAGVSGRICPFGSVYDADP